MLTKWGTRMDSHTKNKSEEPSEEVAESVEAHEDAAGSQTTELTSIDEAVGEIEQKEQIDQAITDHEAAPTTDQPTTPLKVNILKPGLSRRQKWLIAAGATTLLITIIAAVPFLRYAVAGLVIKKPVALSVVDATSGRPVSDVKVTLGSVEVMTDQKGVANINNVSVGDHYVTYEKKNYTTTKTSVLVPILKNYQADAQKLTANGRTVELRFINSINGSAVKGVVASTEGSTTTVDDSGMATIALAANPAKQSLSLKAKGYNDLAATIDTGIDGRQDIKLVPSGRVYFLSKRTGVVSVMSAQLDGSDVREVLRGTGKETDDTSLLAAPDWQNAVMLSRREGSTSPKLYSLNLATGAMRVADDRGVYIQPIGWSGGKFWYQATLDNSSSWTDKANAIMSYDPSSGERRTLDETVGMGSNYYDYASETMTGANIIDGRVVYAKYWSYGGLYTGDRNRPVSFMAVATDTLVRTQLKQLTIPAVSYAQTLLKSPTQLLINFNKPDSSNETYSYTGGALTKIAPVSIGESTQRANYLMSPDGTKVVWTEPRDGKNVSFIANRDLTSQQELGRGDYQPYGWVGQEYVLYSKGQSQLFIAPAGGAFDGSLKITDYHKPAGYPGYGYGYGAV